MFELDTILPYRSYQQEQRLPDAGLLCDIRALRQHNLQLYASWSILERHKLTSVQHSLRNIRVNANRQHGFRRSRRLKHPHPNQTLRLGQIPHLRLLLHSRRPVLLSSQPPNGPSPKTDPRLLILPTIHIHPRSRSSHRVGTGGWKNRFDKQGYRLENGGAYRTAEFSGGRADGRVESACAE